MEAELACGDRCPGREGSPVEEQVAGAGKLDDDDGKEGVGGGVVRVAEPEVGSGERVCGVLGDRERAVGA